MKERSYIAIDLKSFYASVECVERGLDPLDTNLVVADATRTSKTICLAVSPSLKSHGIGGRPRLFEVQRAIGKVNRARCPGRYTGKSFSAAELAMRPELAIDYIVAPPRMQKYIEYSARIYGVYLRHIAPEDIHVYSIDEVFIDCTDYLEISRMTAHELAMHIVRDVLRTTGITATAGIGTNLYLAKVAMDIVAKKMAPDADGVRIAALDEMSYRRLLWAHRPITDFWRVGRGTARRLAQYGLLTMGDVAQCSLRHEGLLHKLFGVNAELLIDHAWGWEPLTIAEIKSYRPRVRSTGMGQVLSEPFPFDRARTVVTEMAESVALDLVKHDMVAGGLNIVVGYDATNLTHPDIAPRYTGPLHTDHYGRSVPAHGAGVWRFPAPTSSPRVLMRAAATLFESIANPLLLVRRLTVTGVNIIPRVRAQREADAAARQLSLFADDELAPAAPTPVAMPDKEQLERELKVSRAIVGIKQRFGKNAILKGVNFSAGATQRRRNEQIGGHKA